MNDKFDLSEGDYKLKKWIYPFQIRIEPTQNS